jgi:hypothetical protein
MPGICAVALVLLLDASGSVSATDWRTQVLGTADGIADEAVTRIIERHAEAGGAVAMTAIAFSDMTVPMVPWRLVRNAAEAGAFAQALRDAPRALYGGTRIGEAIEDAVLALDTAPCEAEQEVIDIASDGDADPGPAMRARDAAAARGVRVNALGIGTLPDGTPADWLRDHAVTMGGFALSAGDWGDFARAMRRKLQMELASR